MHVKIVDSRGNFSKFFPLSSKGERGKETNCKEVGRRGQDRSDILSRLAPAHAHGGITKLKFNYTAGRRTCAAERFPRELSLSLSARLPERHPGKLRRPFRGIRDDRRETSPLRNDRNNLPLSFVPSRGEASTDRRLSFLPSFDSERKGEKRKGERNCFHRHG